MVAYPPNTACNDSQSVEVILLSDEKRRKHNGTTFKILNKLNTQEGSHWVYIIGTHSEHTNCSFHLALNDFASASVISLIDNPLQHTSVSSVLSKAMPEVENMVSDKPDQLFSIDYNNAQVVTLANSLFAKSNSLGRLEAKVLRNTIRRNAKSSSTLPNRL